MEKEQQNSLKVWENKIVKIKVQINKYVKQKYLSINPKSNSLKRSVDKLSSNPIFKRHNNIRNKKSTITSDVEVIFRMITEYHEQIYASMFENLDEVDG